MGEIPFEVLCTQPRDIYDVLAYYDEIALDRVQCYAGVVDALDLKDPASGGSSEDVGCGGGGSASILWPIAALAFMRRQRDQTAGQV